MKPIDFDRTNLTLHPPEGHEDDVGDLHVLHHSQGMLSCWEVSPAELETIKKTGRIWMNLYTDEHPPVQLSTVAMIHTPGPGDTIH